MSSLAQLDLLHLQPGAIGLQPPVEHPLGLVLLGRDEADRVLVQALGRELLLDVRGRSPIHNPGRSLLELAVLDEPGSVRDALQADPGHRAELPCSDNRARARRAPHCRPRPCAASPGNGRRACTRDCSTSEHMVIAIGPSTASTMSARLISLRRPGQREAAARAARARSAGRRRRAGPSVSARSAAERRCRPASSVALRRAPAGRRAAAVIRTTA